MKLCGQDFDASYCVVENSGQDFDASTRWLFRRVS